MSASRIIICIIIFYIEFLWSLNFLESVIFGDYKYCSEKVIKWVRKLFQNKNIFGKIISIFIFIASIPAMLCVLFYDFTILIIKIALCIWELGYKKENK